MRPLRFRVVALIAAYALALHGLLLAFAVVAPINAASHIASLCSGLTADQDKTVPGDHDASCAMACATLGGKIAAAVQPVVAVATPSLALVLRPAIAQAPTVSASDDPPRARAPPLV